MQIAIMGFGFGGSSFESSIMARVAMKIRKWIQSPEFSSPSYLFVPEDFVPTGRGEVD
jgi:hypothetical protein